MQMTTEAIEMGWDLAARMTKAHYAGSVDNPYEGEEEPTLEDISSMDCYMHDIIGLLIAADLPWWSPVAHAWGAWHLGQISSDSDVMTFYAQAPPDELDDYEAAALDLIERLFREIENAHGGRVLHSDLTRADMPEFHSGLPEGW
jgi:hypothetical protein|uniref:Uncharacterized protein n=1 Tax=uncultured marine virus TaxID=186617 RepID=A0A0F7L419_9VIRU|nr:hypothetical protein [uncultured marine virus]